MANELILSQKEIENRIFTIRGVQVMLDTDLAIIYNVETRVLNQAVKRNIERFPDDFMFQLTEDEWKNLKSQFVMSSEHGGRRTRPYAFTEQGVFFDGQIFDAYQLTSKIIRSAKQSIILIDNYIDETTIAHLAKKNKKVKVLLLTKNKTKQVQLDVKKANEQYGDFQVQSFSKSHDRFLIIDETEIYHLGASLKDLGKKMVCFC